jgi:hypothetical protein
LKIKKDIYICKVKGHFYSYKDEGNVTRVSENTLVLNSIKPKIVSDDTSNLFISDTISIISKDKLLLNNRDTFYYSKYIKEHPLPPIKPNF